MKVFLEDYCVRAPMCTEWILEDEEGVLQRLGEEEKDLEGAEVKDMKLCSSP